MSEIMQVTAMCFGDGLRKKNVRFVTNNICYRCGCALPDFLPKAFFSPNNNELFVYLLFNCPHCHQSFVFEYRITGDPMRSNDIDLSKRTPKIFPNCQLTTVFDEKINDLSPGFIEIYHQAEIAESAGCTQICGMGYRKALEFLVKDFLCKTTPEQVEKIKTEFLATAISRIEAPKIQTLASRSTWLANDECHYTQKWEEYDVEDLKRFIKALVYFLESELAFEEALAMEYRR